MIRKTGEMVALQSDDGEVYVGFVTHVSDGGKFDCDLVADHHYRTPERRCIRLVNA